MSLTLKRMILGPIATNVYIVINDAVREAVVIDPAAKPGEIMRTLEDGGISLKAILLTHGHFDHLLAVGELRRLTRVPVYASEKERGILADPSEFGCDFKKYAVTDFTPLEDGDEIELIGCRWRVIATPGHTAGSVCYYLENERLLFSGDTLFDGGYGRTDLPTGSMDEIRDSLVNRLFVMPDETDVYPGHGEKTFLGREKKYNAIKEIGI